MVWFDPRIRPSRHAALGAAATAFYLAGDAITSVFEFWPGTAALFIPAGIAIALLVGLGPGHGATLAVGMAIAAFWPDPSSYPLPAIVLWVLLVALVYTAAAWWLRERTRFDPAFTHFGDAARFIAAFLAASLIASVFVTVARQATTAVEVEAPIMTVAFWIGDAAAIFAIAPFLLIWVIPRLQSEPRPPRMAREAGRLELLGQVLTILIALVLVAEGVVRAGNPVLFVLFIPMFWIAIRSGVDAVVIANAVLTMGAAAGLAAEPISAEPALILCSVLVILSATTLLIGAALEERARVADGLRRREWHLAHAEEVARLGSWHWDEATRTYAWSDGLYRIHGLPVGSTIEDWDFLRYVAGDEREAVEAVVRESLLALRPFEVEYTLEAADGRIRRVLVRGDPEGDAEGRLKRVIGTCQDVTELRLAEREAWESKRLEALGTLATGVAHDFNNLLMVIQGTASLLRDQPDPQVREDVARIEEAVHSAGRLNDQLIAFARGGRGPEMTTDLNQGLRENEWVLRRMLGPEVRLLLELQDDLSGMKIPRSALEQIVNNLVANARDAFDDPGGEVLVATAAVDEEWIELRVRDNGRGMDPETRRRIFDPFFTTKGREGSGIGLATVLRIVRQIGGRIRVESAVGIGTTFVLTLPRTVEARTSESTAGSGDASSGSAAPS